MHPTVRIELDPLDLKGDLMLVALLAALSIVSAAIALAATIAYVIVLSRPNHAMELL